MNFGQEEALTAKARLREEVETILTTELRLALDRFQSAISALKHEAAEGSSGTSHPGRSVRLEEAQQAKAAASGELQRALTRHNRFILDREVPAEPGSTPGRRDAGPDPGSEDPLDPLRYSQARALD